MHFFKRTTSSQNRVNDTNEEMEQRASSQKQAPQPSIMPQNFPGMSKPLTRPLFREPGTSVSPPATRHEHLNADSPEDSEPRSHRQGTAVHEKQGVNDNTIETTSQIVRDITSRCDMVLGRAQNLLIRAKEQEGLVNKVLEAHKSRSRLPSTQSEEPTPLPSPSKGAHSAATGDGSVLPSAQLSPPVAQKSSGWFNWVSTPGRRSGSADGPDAPASPPAERPPSPSLLRRVCRSIQRLSQHLTSPAPASATATPARPDSPAGEDDASAAAPPAHRKSVLFLGPDRLENATPTRARRSPAAKSEPAAEGPPSAASTPRPPAPRQSAVKRSRSPLAAQHAGGKRRRSEAAPAKIAKSAGSSPKRRSAAAKTNKPAVDERARPPSGPLPASARSSTSSQGSNLKWQQHLEMVQYIQANSIKKCLSNFTKADLLKFLHSEGVAHVSEELNKKKLLDEVRALVHK